MPSAIPYISLDRVKGKTRIEIAIKNDVKSFLPTPAGIAKLAKVLVACKADTFLHSSSLNHPTEYGLPDRDIIGDINLAWEKLRPPTPVGWWVFVCTPNGELLKYGRDADTKYPYATEEQAVDQAEYLSEEEDEDDRIYIATVFATGQIRHEEWERF